MKDNQKQEGLIYCICHNFKHNLFTPIIETGVQLILPVISESLRRLWSQRFHEHYYAHPKEEEHQLAELINFDITLTERLTKDDPFLCLDKRNRDIYRRIASPHLVIPGVEDMCKRGILVDVINEAEQRIRLETLESGYLTEDHRDFIKVIIDRRKYALFMVGYVFPHLEKNSNPKEILWNNPNVKFD